MNVAATLENVDRVVLSARSRDGIVDTIERVTTDRDINIDPLIVRLTPSPELGLEIIVNAEGYLRNERVVSVGQELTFDFHARRDLELVMNQSFLEDDFDHDGYRLCGTGPPNNDKPCDCDDNLAAVNPFSPEVCGNASDDDCNGEVNDGC